MPSTAHPAHLSTAASVFASVIASRSAVRNMLAGLVFCVLTVPVQAQHSGTGPQKNPAGVAPTFAQDVAPILYRNCTVCHRAGAIGPFPLFTYDSAKAYEHEILEKISQGEMPPWHEVGPRGVFSNDRRLSEADKNTIIRWIDGGAKPGDLRKLPSRPVYPDSWSIGTPDVVFSMPADFEVAAAGTIDYQHFQVQTNFTEDKWIQAYEIMPGNRQVVHHVQVYAKAPPDPPGAVRLLSPIARNRTYEPIAQPATGFLSLLSLMKKPKGASVDYGVLIGSMAPGTNPIEFPIGTALRIKAGTVLTFGMHYTATGHKMKDRSMIAFRFAKAPPEEEMIATAVTNEVFVIPPGAKNVLIPSEFSVREPIKIWGFLPHTHLRGTRWLYTMVKPDGTSETILDIPHYDFNWQTYYLWSKPLEVPTGAKITASAWYDNSAANTDNPDPHATVRPGLQTWEEMQYTGFLYTIPSRKVKRPSGR